MLSIVEAQGELDKMVCLCASLMATTNSTGTIICSTMYHNPRVGPLNGSLILRVRGAGEPALICHDLPVPCTAAAAPTAAAAAAKGPALVAAYCWVAARGSPLKRARNGRITCRACSSCTHASRVGQASGWLHSGANPRPGPSKGEGMEFRRHGPGGRRPRRRIRWPL